MHTGEGAREQEKGDGQAAQEQHPSTAEKTVVVLSVALTLLLFGYAGWQIATPPQAGSPQVSVAGTETLSDGTVAVTVQLRNPTDVGLVTATVEADCSSSPPAVEFTYVPPADTRTATLVCPAGTTDPSVSIVNWVSQ